MAHNDDSNGTISSGESSSASSVKTRIQYLLSLMKGQLLRLSVSDISGITGYNQFKSPLDLIERYIYQDVEELHEIEANSLGLEIISKEDEALSVLKRLKSPLQTEVNNLRKKLKSSETLGDTNKLVAATMEMRTLVNNAKDGKGVILTRQEIRVIEVLSLVLLKLS